MTTLGFIGTGGMGVGIDRLTMFLSDHNNIKEVLLFPAMKPDETKSDTVSKKLAESIRKANKAEAAQNATMGTASSPPVLLAAEASLRAGGGLFFSGARPSAADAAARGSAGSKRLVTACNLVGAPGLARWCSSGATGTTMRR